MAKLLSLLRRIPSFIFAGLFLICSILVYYWSADSRIQSLRCQGNVFYDEQAIYERAGLNEYSRMWIPSFLLRHTLMQDEMIQDVEIEKNGQSLTFTITETPVLGYDQSSEGLTILTVHQQEIPVPSQREQQVMAAYPRIIDLSPAQKDALADAFGTDQSIDPQLLSSVAQIQSWPQSYDPDQLRIQMTDGNVLFVSYDGLDLLGQYSALQEQIRSPNACLVLDGVNAAAARMACDQLHLSAEEREQSRVSGQETASSGNESDLPADADHPTQEEDPEIPPSSSIDSEDEESTSENEPETESESSGTSEPPLQEERISAADWQACVFDWMLYSPSTGVYQDIYDGSQYVWDSSILSFRLYAQ